MMLKYFLPPILFVFILIGCRQDGEDVSARQTLQQPAAGADISDDELDQFIRIFQDVQRVQMESQQEMVNVVEEEGLDVDTFNYIAQARFDDTPDEQLNVTTEQLDMFEIISEKIEKIEEELSARMGRVIREAGMEEIRFMEINMNLHRDPALQQRVQEKVARFQPDGLDF